MSADEDDGQDAGDHAGPSKGGAEGEFAETRRDGGQGPWPDGLALVLAEVAHAGVSEDKKEKQDGTVRELEPVSGGEAGGGALGNGLRKDEIDDGDEEPGEGADARGEVHAPAPLKQGSGNSDQGAGSLLPTLGQRQGWGTQSSCHLPGKAGASASRFQRFARDDNSWSRFGMTRFGATHSV